MSSSRQAELTHNYDQIVARVHALNPAVRVVAVSKLKPASDILALYNHGVRHFGENYVQELVAKAAELPRDIQWHYIGALQTAKCRDLARDIPNLYAVETVDSLKKCKKLDSVRRTTSAAKVNVYLQINTLGEAQKAGFAADDPELAQTVAYLCGPECTHLRLQGLMTIGSLAASTAAGQNPEFAELVRLKRALDLQHGLDLHLSMGMSADFEEAVRQGSSSVRVGSAIFGARPAKT
jgi:pyridoxal phosphate enzyme (YggS family)